MWLLWLSVKRLVEVAILGTCLFAVPDNRTESVVVAAAAAVWLSIRHQVISAETVTQGRMKFAFQLLRVILARLDRDPSNPSFRELEADFKRIQEEVGIGDDVILSDRYNPPCQDS